MLNGLYKHTTMQSTFGVIMLALVPDSHTGRLVPKIMPLKEVLVHYIDHRHTVIVRRAQVELDKALEREHPTAHTTSGTAPVAVAARHLHLRARRVDITDLEEPHRPREPRRLEHRVHLRRKPGRVRLVLGDSPLEQLAAPAQSIAFSCPCAISIHHVNGCCSTTCA